MLRQANGQMFPMKFIWCSFIVFHLEVDRARRRKRIETHTLVHSLKSGYHFAYLHRAYRNAVRNWNRIWFEFWWMDAFTGDERGRFMFHSTVSVAHNFSIFPQEKRDKKPQTNQKRIEMIAGRRDDDECCVGWPANDRFIHNFADDLSFGRQSKLSLKFALRRNLCEFGRICRMDVDLTFEFSCHFKRLRLQLPDKLSVSWWTTPRQWMTQYLRAWNCIKIRTIECGTHDTLLITTRRFSLSISINRFRPSSKLPIQNVIAIY